ncbi:MAG: hypothetical protein E7442_02290 [Ruminococcaceae bacterium]|nr:hypothetical protein [Oscillospiraceae bacterium]
MREIKRYALILLTLALLLSGCALPEMKGVDWDEIKGKESAEPTAAPAPTPTPRPAGAEGAVLDFLEALSYDDRVTVRALGGEDLPGYRSAQPLESRSLRELYRSVYQSLTWRIGAVNESNANATVTVEITAPDMRRVLAAFSESMAAETLTAESREAKCDELFLYALEDAGRECVTKKVNISLYRKESAWALAMSSDLMNALTGGLTQGLMDFDVPAAPGGEAALTSEDRDGTYYLIANDICSLVVTAIRPNDAEGYVLFGEAKNFTNSEMVFSLRNTVINGYMLDPDWYVSVPAHGMKEFRIVWDRGRLLECGIESVESILLTADAFEKPAWPVYPISSQTGVIYPYGQTELEPQRVHSATERVLLDDGIGCFSVLSVDSDGCWGHDITVYLENRTGEELWFSIGDTMINGVTMDRSWSQTIPAWGRAVEHIRWSAGDLIGADIAAVESLDFRLYVSTLTDLDNSEREMSTGGHFVLN